MAFKKDRNILARGRKTREAIECCFFFFSLWLDLDFSLSQGKKVFCFLIAISFLVLELRKLCLTFALIFAARHCLS